MKVDIKQKCAKEALKLIPKSGVIGLGGGSTISYLIDEIKENKLNVQIVTPSVKTKMLCLEKGLTVLDPMAIHQIDIAFDGCDEVDANFNALKSGGGIHTREKLIASMSKDYVLLIDETKFSEVLTFKHPVVLEVLESAISYVQYEVLKLGGVPVMRHSSAKDGFTITENGHYLMDVTFSQVSDIKELNVKLNEICGVIGTSLFTKEVTKVLIVDQLMAKEC